MGSLVEDFLRTYVTIPCKTIYWELELSKYFRESPLPELVAHYQLLDQRRRCSPAIPHGQGCWTLRTRKHWLAQSLSSSTKELMGRGSACSSISNSRVASPLIGFIVWASTATRISTKLTGKENFSVKYSRHLNYTSANPTTASIKKRTHTTAFLLLRPQMVFLLTMLSRLAWEKSASRVVCRRTSSGMKSDL